ncbi:MAG: hypothetical protein ACK56F_20745 [bacterium]
MTASQGAANRSAAYWFIHTVATTDQFNRHHIEIKLRPEFAK